ncbi:hypothetical protein PghCCS26_18570 [Paenibacillus glycanilyticus]|uniref:Uncharacterized protein n=1 Tax=Paenibacillus glycanilyticus TaxID=126569 RepID=A0ABQ6NL33_9BACL|nr:hypothetical protein PghCCS26_18570 [Paenibacillus glycanilyticus]
MRFSKNFRDFILIMVAIRSFVKRKVGNFTKIGLKSCFDNESFRNITNTKLWYFRKMTGMIG